MDLAETTTEFLLLFANQTETAIENVTESLAMFFNHTDFAFETVTESLSTVFNGTDSALDNVTESLSMIFNHTVLVSETVTESLSTFFNHTDPILEKVTEPMKFLFNHTESVLENVTEPLKFLFNHTDSASENVTEPTSVYFHYTDLASENNTETLSNIFNHTESASGNDTETILNIFNHTNSNVTAANISTVFKKSVLSKYYPYLVAELGLSILCSILLILVYVLIGEHRTIPGKNVISISVCLIITYVLLSIDLLMRNTIPFGICYAMGVTVQTTFLATFFWTNVMSYDIMRTMASVRPDLTGKSKFWMYSAYVWTMTLLCIVPAVVVDNVDLVPFKFRPQIGVKKCWLSSQLAFYLYFNGPVAFTLFTNCVFFAITARTIVKVRNATAILASNRHKKRFRLCLKLVLVMGLVWTTEFLPKITGIYWLYAVAGMLNCLHGVYLFLIFVCKKRIFKQIAGLLCLRVSSPPNVQRKQSPSLDTVSTTVP